MTRRHRSRLALPSAPGRLTRAFTTVAAVIGSGLVLLGLAITPLPVLVALVVVAVLIGPGVVITVHSTRRDLAAAFRAGAVALAAALVVGFGVTGLVALLGSTAVPLLLLLAVAGGIWVRRHRPSWLDGARHASTGRPTARPTDAGSTGGAPDRRAEPDEADLPAFRVGTAATHALCAAWQHTYWMLHDLPPTSPRRLIVTQIRGELLEELERRDPAGFEQWLHTEPRACSDPGRYLTAGR